MPSQITPKTNADPRSGSISTSSAGTATMTSDVANTRSDFMLCSLSEKNFASMITVVIFAISDGCTCVPPSTIQRREPYALAPTANTKSNAAIDTTYSVRLSGPKMR